MGLLYVFPVSLEEKDFVEVSDQKITLKSYGLPYLFWGYALAILLMVFFMFLAIKAPVLKLIQLGDETDALLGYALLTFLGMIPLFLLAFFVFEKRIIKTKEILRLEYRIYGLKVFSETFSIMFQDLSTVSLQQFVDGVCQFLVGMSDQLDPRMDTDLLNLRDEMLALINKSKYLFTLEN